MKTVLSLSVLTSTLWLASCAFNDNASNTSGSQGSALQNKASRHTGKLLPVQFKNVTQSAGLTSEPSWKYGGPAVADLNNDGRYEFLLGNHDKQPLQLFWANADNTYTEHMPSLMGGDVHGIAAGDYDRDGDNDLLVSLGGGNASNPKPPRMLRNDGGRFTDVTQEAGIAEMGARGRSVRWLDLDGDHDLDFLQINAEPAPTETGPRNIVFENIGAGKFQYHNSGAFEHIDAERVLVTDFNADRIPDLVAFSPYSPVTLWQGKGNFQFEDVTAQKLPAHLQALKFVSAVAQSDIDNDGDIDLYLARGKTYYQVANNSISFNAETARLDLRDEGNKSHDGLRFIANKRIELRDFWHWPRGKDITLPVFLGQKKVQLDTPQNGAPQESVVVHADEARGFPTNITQSGWYLGYIDTAQSVDSGSQSASSGQGEWRLEWHLADNLAWDIRASIVGVKSVNTPWQPQELGVPDVLLEYNAKTGTYSDASHKLPEASNDNNWGVITADFDNNTYNDFFVYRFGELTERIADVLILNTGSAFTASTQHQANVLGQGGHGDMGAAFDFNHDGWMDILSGDDDYGRWYLYQNIPPSTAVKGAAARSAIKESSHFVQLRIGQSPQGVDPIGAEVTVETSSSKKSAKVVQFKRVESSSATHSQSLLNILHFGLGQADHIDRIHIKWRDGTELERHNLSADQLYRLGQGLK